MEKIGLKKLLMKVLGIVRERLGAMDGHTQPHDVVFGASRQCPTPSSATFSSPFFSLPVLKSTPNRIIRLASSTVKVTLRLTLFIGLEKMMIYSKWLRTLFVIVLSGLFFSNNIFAQDVTDSTTTNITTTTPTTNKDPLERFNRAMFQFNDFLDRYILKPVANLYIQIVPKPLSKGLSNIYNNIDTVPTVLNDLLQFNFYQATSDVWRLAFNSTIGILGFFDVAKELGLEPNYEDFGLTLARWGYTNSTYIVIPFLGPSTIRDTLGFPVNYYYLSIYPYVDPIQARYALYFTGVVVRRADILRYDSLMQQLSFDKYIFMRDAYLQHRNYLIERNDQLSNPYIAKYQLEKEEAETSQQDVKSNIETKPFADV